MLHDEVFCIYYGKYQKCIQCVIIYYDVLVYIIATRLCEHSNSVKFEKYAAKTVQHGHRYGDILMSYDMINIYELFSAIIDTNYVLLTNY